MAQPALQACRYLARVNSHVADQVFAELLGHCVLPVLGDCKNQSTPRICLTTLLATLDQNPRSRRLFYTMALPALQVFRYLACANSHFADQVVAELLGHCVLPVLGDCRPGLVRPDDGDDAVVRLFTQGHLALL